MSDVSEYLAKMANSPSSSSEHYRQLQKYYERRLWHQMTEELLALVNHADFRSGQEGGKQAMELYRNVVQDIEIKISPLKLATLTQSLSSLVGDGAEADAFVAAILAKIEDAKSKEKTEAMALINVVRGGIQLRAFGNVKECKSFLGKAESLLDEVESVGFIHRDYYWLLAELEQRQGNFNAYYTACLKFLGCSELKERSDEDNSRLAKNLALAALLGSEIFNFGELLMHPILDFLKGTKDEWLVTLIKAFNAGSVEQFEAMKKTWKNQPDLANNENVLEEKIRLLCLMELSFRKPATQRQLPFDEISEATKLQKGQVELLIMKALARDLIRGQIDQVDQVLLVQWVQPRVLDHSQVSTLITKLDNWCSAIGNMENLIETSAADILTN